LPGKANRKEGGLSLRLRLLISIAFVLALTLFVGGGLIYFEALNKVDTEMRAALAVGIQTVQNATDDADEAINPLRQLELLVEDFNGNRHVRAFLMNNAGVPLDSSVLLIPSYPAPEWFDSLLAREPEFAHIFLPAPFARYGSIILTTDSHNEIAEAWSDFVLTLVILALFCTLVLGLIYFTLGQPLRLLQNMTAAFKLVGSGDYSPRIKEAGSRELANLARSFNEMVTRLGAMEHQNYSLEAQLATVQEEERVDLARDLHDEIGPLLFALNIDVSALRSADWSRSPDKVAKQLDGMSSAIGAIQLHVRSMLGKLRPAVLLDLGLRHAVDNLVTFWSTRHRDVRIAIELERESFGEKLDATIYRILQESLNNALRHGHPSWVEIRARVDGDEFVEVAVCDNGFGLVPGTHFGFGLTGMKERVESLGGSFVVGNRADATGAIVRAKLPLSQDALVREEV
jgi:two-component system, NarL family, sensor histidine kinase UhpB